MIEGKTASGFQYELSQKRLSNYELVEALSMLDDNPLLLPKVIVLLLGKNQAEKLKDHIRDDEGIVDTQLIEKEITEIFEQQKSVKN